MPVTQDYKILTLTASEAAAVEAALYRECSEMQNIADCYPPGSNFSRLVYGLLADLKSALAKVRA
jgi:hypothetical protein